MNKTIANHPELILLDGVKLTYPFISKKNTYQGKETKYEATFMIEPNSSNHTQTAAKLAEFQQINGIVRIAPDKICLKSDIRAAVFAGKFGLKASSRDRIPVIDAQKNTIPVHTLDQYIYN